MSQTAKSPVPPVPPVTFPKHDAGPCSACQGSGRTSVYLGSDLRAAREEQGIGLREMARYLNRSAMYLTDLELGRRTIHENMADGYAEVISKFRSGEYK